MASTYSDLKIELIGTGEQTGTWGSTTNTNLGTALEEAITGSADVSFSSSDVTLTLTNTNGTQTARNLRLVCTGTSGGARNLILGSGCQIEKLYLIQNDLADTVTVKNTTGTGVDVPAGARTFVFNNGTNVIPATNASGFSGTLPIANGGTGATDAGTARTNLGLGTISTQNSNSVSITGGSITGITDLAVADGGTGASTAANARTNLGLGSLATLNTINNGNWSGTDLAVGNGGTGASDTATARSNLDVPSRSGSGASGTWGINISGNAGTATSATSATQLSGGARVGFGTGTTLSINLAYQVWTRADFITQLNNAYLVKIQWSRNGEGGPNDFSYYTGAVITGGNNGMGNIFASTQSVFMLGGGSYGETVQFRISYGSGIGSRPEFYWSGSKGFAGLATSPMPTTVVVYQLT
jgi:hypothetical protein